MPCRSLASFFTWRTFPGSGAIISSIGRWTSTGRCWRYPRPKGSFTSNHAWFARAFQETSSDVPASPGRSLRRTGQWEPVYARLLYFLPALFYSSAMQGALLFEATKVDKYENAMHIALDEENAAWVAGRTQKVDADGRVRPPAQTGPSGNRWHKIRGTSLPPEGLSDGGPMRTWNAV